jgi:hypothetical protein
MGKVDVIMPIAKAKIVSIVNMDTARLHTAEIVTMDTVKHAQLKNLNKQID